MRHMPQPASQARSPTSPDCTCATQVRLASVRRSLFASEQARSAFLNALVTGTRDILHAQTGLREHGNYHEFCRLLGRLKTNYQLNELVRIAFCHAWDDVLHTSGREQQQDYRVSVSFS